MNRQQPLFFDTKGMTREDLEPYGEFFAEQQRDVNWMIGDIARYARYGLRLGENYSQVFPEWVSPGLIQRCEAVASAYPRIEDRNPDATWTIHMQESKKDDRIARVQAHVDAGRTSDEAVQASRKESSDNRWLLAVDISLYVNKWWHSGNGVESASGVSSWIARLTERLKEKRLTDVACCFDAPENHRKQLTEEWEDKYKDRPKKDPELSQQLHLVRELLEKQGFACVSIPGMEADDVMASYAKQFPGKVTLLTQDKDQRQCLSSKCNILLDIEWIQDESSGDHVPVYKWLSAKDHTEETGLTPSQWIEFQCVAGDTVDGIRGVEGVGQKGATDFIKEFGSVEALIEAAKEEDERITLKKREALIAFEPKLEVTRKLVTLRNDLPVPMATRINK